jgi:hypothetical protein
MRSLSDDEKRLILGDALADQLQAILECVQLIPEIKVMLTSIEQDIAVIKTDLKIIKAILTDKPLTKLKSAARHPCPQRLCYVTLLTLH